MEWQHASASGLKAIGNTTTPQRRLGARLDELDLDHDGKTQKQQKPERGPPEPRHPPAKCPETRQKKEQHNPEFQSKKSQHPSVLCRNTFFLLAGQLVHVTWSCSFIIGWWEVKDLYMILELGRSPLCTVKRETSWWKLRTTKFGSWKRSNSKKQGRGPPGTQAPPGQVPGDTAKERTSQPTTWSKASTLRLYTLDCLMP